MLAEANADTKNTELEKALAEEKAQVKLLKEQLEKAKGKLIDFSRLSFFLLDFLCRQMKHRKSHT